MVSEIANVRTEFKTMLILEADRQKKLDGLCKW